MTILVIDGQGGKVGQLLVEKIRARYPDARLMAVGTNTAATAAMLRGGAAIAATGENAVAVACRTANVVIGPIGIVIADALYGEVTPRMAISVAQAQATRILIPFNQCDHFIAGMPSLPLPALIDAALDKLGQLMQGETHA